MKHSWLGLVIWGVPLLVSCGGTARGSAGSGGQSGDPSPNPGVAGTKAMPDVPEPQPGGTSGSSGVPPQGVCTKLCVNTASFSFDNPVPIDELFTGSLKACHNDDQECHTGPLPQRDTGGNTIAFPGANSWDGPNVWSPDGWRTIEYSWGSTDPMALRDGDRFSLTFVSARGPWLLFESDVTFQVINDCAGTCRSARYDFRGTPLGEGGSPPAGEGGSPPSAEAGASFGGAEAGTGEGGAASN